MKVQIGGATVVRAMFAWLLPAAAGSNHSQSWQLARPLLWGDNGEAAGSHFERGFGDRVVPDQFAAKSADAGRPILHPNRAAKGAPPGPNREVETCMPRSRLLNSKEWQ